jgi:hypothetical protein
LIFSHRFREASLVLYNQNTLDFDHPLSLIVLTHKISPSSLHSIRSLYFEPQRHLYIQKSSSLSPGTKVDCESSYLDYWDQMWDVIADMQSLEEVRVRFRSRFRGWMGWKEEDILDPLWKVTRPLKVFNVEAPWTAADMGYKTDNLEGEMPFKLLGCS